MSSTTVNPLAAMPAITSAAPALRSGAATCAPARLPTPVINAVLP